MSRFAGQGHSDPHGGAGDAAHQGAWAGAGGGLLIDAGWSQESILERTLVVMIEAYRRRPRSVVPLGPASAPGALPEGRPERDAADHRAALPEARAVPTADELETLLPGPELAAALDALGRATSAAEAPDTDALVEGIAACERLVAWATARQAALVTALDVREHRAGRGEFVADAISTRLGITRRSATLKTELADGLVLFPPVGVALERGEVDSSKARVLVDEIAAAPASVSDALLATFLPDAARLTAPQLRSRIRRAAQSIDPTLASRRAEGEAERRAVRLTPAPDAMAYLTAYLPAVDAATCMAALDALADAAATPGDERTADARRADALTDGLRSILESGLDLDGTALPTRQRRRPHIQVTVAATTLLGLDERPGELAGYGAIPASVTRAVAQDGTWRALLVDAGGQVVARGGTTYRPGADVTGTVVARDATCRFPGCAVPAWRCDLDHVTPFDGSRPAGEQTVRENLHALCRHHHRLKTRAGWTVAREAATGRTTWTTPWGRTYVRDLDPSGHLVAEPSRPPTEPDPSPDPGPPPF